MDALSGSRPCLPTAQDVAWLRIDEQSAVGRARRTVSALAERLGFPAARVAEIEIAVSELASNLSLHAKDGVLLVRSVHTERDVLVEVAAVDGGPGIADVDLALRDGHSTAGTLGIGLGAIHRLADAYDVFSSVGNGTVLVARFRSQRLAASPCDGPGAAAGVTRALHGEEVCGDGYAVRRSGGRSLLMLCDGAGHGPLAATASQRAVRAFCEVDATDPGVLVGRIDKALVGSRGGAVAVAEVDPQAGTVRFAGVGNVAGAVVADGTKRSMVSLPGIAGYQARTIRVFDYPLPARAAVVLHSDGLHDRWTAEACEGVVTRQPLLLAMVLMRTAGTRLDDASVLVATVPAT